MELGKRVLRWWAEAPTLILMLIIAVLLAWTFGTRLISMGVLKGTALVIVGLIAGLLGGLIGTGGCSVMLPIIHFWMGYPAAIAVGTTLFAVIFTAVSGGYGHVLQRNVDVRVFLLLGLGGLGGVVLGSWLFMLISAQTGLLGMVLGLFFLGPAIRMVYEGAVQRARPKPEDVSIQGSGRSITVFGFVVGIATGLAGLGGGYALVPGLIYLFGAPVYLTMGTSLATMIPLALVGGGIKLVQGFVDLPTGLLLGAGTVVGARAGAAVIKRFKPATLKLIFGIYFLYVSAKFIISKRAHANNPILDDSEKLARRAWFFQAVGHEVRLMIFGLLEVEQLCFCDIIQTLQVPSSTVAHHLRMLEDARDYGKENGKYTSFMLRNDLIAI